ncbi:MAG TPA: hypothetical protein VGR66_04535 [Candidatus Eisenbacteria bacterium]|jgi:hypothetical protein|nr:hypothetical protein [Candidatus Eisenbacteria bacterium]
MSQRCLQSLLIALFAVAIVLGVSTGVCRRAWAGPNWAGELNAAPEATGRGVRAPGGLGPNAVPEIFGPGRVTTFCNMWMKVTNIGVVGNPFTNTSSDPSGQWPGASGVEYLFFAGIWAGAVNPEQTDPSLKRRVSATTEWRPPTLDERDRIYLTYDGNPSGQRLVDDDSDNKIDEDPLDGYDNDGDGKVDEDYGAISQQEFTCLMRDDTQEAIDTPATEKHVPLGLQLRQSVYAFSVPGANDFASIEWELTNITNHELDSVYVGVRIDQDVGPVIRDRYFSDDLPEPRVPQGPDPTIAGSPDNPDNPNYPYIRTRNKTGSLHINDLEHQDGLCSQDTVYINGFTMIDDDGDQGQTPGASVCLLLGHTIDPTGQKAPRRVGFNMYTYFQPGTPYAQGGVPQNDAERFDAMSRSKNIDHTTGLITQQPPDANEINDYSSLFSVGPFLHMQPGETVSMQWALGAQQVDYLASRENLKKRYPKLIDMAVGAELTYRGSYEQRQGIEVPGPDDFGRETCLKKVPGGPTAFADCRDPEGTNRSLLENECTWFDLDCNFCTGVPGYVLKRWTASAPPPNPDLKLIPHDRSVTLEWDNKSEATTDPVQGDFDFKGYKIWKAANWTRPVGSSGPGDDLWSLLATYYYYDGVLNPLILKTEDGRDSVVAQNLLLNRNTGEILYPNDVPCLEKADEPGVCDQAQGKKFAVSSTGADSTIDPYFVTRYPVGRYTYEDRNVLNGFLYFYSVTAFDSTGKGSLVAEQEGRQAAVEGEGVVPQNSFAAGANGGKPYVVPNPYRGRSDWDLTPNATDPTGTHVDFFNLPQDWTQLRIYTVSGDLVQILHPGDAQTNGHPQQESANDAQATWNLISRNGQDVVSGIYLFSVESQGGKTTQGKFTIIR